MSKGSSKTKVCSKPAPVKGRSKWELQQEISRGKMELIDYLLRLNLWEKKKLMVGTQQLQLSNGNNNQLIEKQ